MSSHCSISLNSNTGKPICPPPSCLFLQSLWAIDCLWDLFHCHTENKHFQSDKWEDKHTHRHARRSHSLVYKGNQAKTRLRQCTDFNRSSRPRLLNEILTHTEIYEEPHSIFNFLFFTPFLHQQSTFLSNSCDCCAWVLNILMQVFLTFVF